MTSGNVSVDNLALVDARIDKGSTEFKLHHTKLRSFLGVKLRALEAKVAMHEDFVNKVAKDDQFA